MFKPITRPLAVAGCVLVAAALSASPAHAGADSVSWSADPGDGVDTFQSIQCDTDTFTTTTDPERGLVWQAEQPAGLERCESVGPDVTDGSTYYLGWSSKFHITDSTSRYLF